MNEKIKELVGKAWEQANKEVSEDDWYTWVHDEIFQTKLVELVVRECAQVCINLQDIPATEPRHCAEDIKIHFGVEE